MAASAARRREAGRAADAVCSVRNSPGPTSPGPHRPGPNIRLEIRDDPLKGRGVFAGTPITADTVIEAAPVIVVPAAQRQLLDQTILHDYYFSWDADPGGEESGAVALGIVSLCNHSRHPRARVRRNVAQGTLDLVALVTIAAGDEVTIDYNCPLWFAAED